MWGVAGLQGARRGLLEGYRVGDGVVRPAPRVCVGTKVLCPTSAPRSDKQLVMALSDLPRDDHERTTDTTSNFVRAPHLPTPAPRVCVAPLAYPRLPPSPISAPCHPLVTCATPRPPGLTHPQARSAPPSPSPVQPPAPPAPRAATWLCAPCKPPRRIRRAALPAPSRVGIRAPAPGPPAPPGPALGRPGSQPAGSSASAA